MRAAASGPRFVQSPLQLYGLREIRQRVLGCACLRVHDAAIEISPGVARIDFDDGVEVAARVAEIALLKENASAIEQGLDVAWGELQRLVVIAERAGAVAPPIAGEAAVAPGGGKA